MRIRENDTFMRYETEMIFDNFSYIKTETISGDIRTDVKNMLLANGSLHGIKEASRLFMRKSMRHVIYHWKRHMNI